MMTPVRRKATLDPDVETLLREMMREKGLTFKAALNQALRDGLHKTTPKSPRPYRLKSHRMGFQPDLQPDRALSLAAALEEEEIARKLRLRKRSTST
jgi:hypothetical protein